MCKKNERKNCAHFLFIVRLGLDPVACAEEPVCGDRRSEEQQSEGVPAEHMPPGSVRAFEPHPDGDPLQLLRDPVHPHQRVDEQRWDAKQVCFPVSLCPVPEDLIFPGPAPAGIRTAGAFLPSQSGLPGPVPGSSRNPGPHPRTARSSGRTHSRRHR